jgi:ACS family glucarate transporter-like MFS transporter
MPTPRPPVRIRWWIFLFTFAFLFLCYVQRTSIGIAAERMEPELHLSQMQIGWMMWAFTLMYMLMQLPAGVFGQRFGARMTLTLGGALGVIAMVATPLAPVVLTGGALFLVMVFFQGLLGVAQTPFVPVTAGVYEAWFPSRQWALIQGIGASGGSLGGALVPPVIVLLTRAYGWQGALYWLSVPAVALTIFWARYARNTPREHPSVTQAELAELDASTDEVKPLTWQRLSRIATNRDVLLLTISYVCSNYSFYLLNNWSFLYLVQDRHLSALQSGFLAVLPSIGAAVGAAIGGYVADVAAARFGARRGYALVPLLSLPVAGTLLLLVTHVSNVTVAVAVLTGAFFAVEMTEGPFWAATMRVARADTMAATGVLNTGGNLGGVIGIPIVAYLSGRQSWGEAFATGTALALVSAALWLFIDPNRSSAAGCPV